MDQHPTMGRESGLSTLPPIGTSALIRRQPRKMGMLGRATPKVSTGEHFHTRRRTDPGILAAWDYARVHEPLFKEGLNMIASSVAAMVGPYSHPHPMIEAFVGANIKAGIRKWLKDLSYQSLWAGHGVGEAIWTQKIGPSGEAQTWVTDLITYHPTEVRYIVNGSGMLTHGEKVPYATAGNVDFNQTGIWVPKPLDISHPTPGGWVRLNKGKFCHTVHEGMGNNPEGESMLTAVFEYHLFKRSILDLMMVALDRYGTPIVYAIVPIQQSDEQHPTEDRPMFYHEVVARELSEMRSEVGLVLTQLSADQPVKLEALTTGSNFASAFTDAINMCDLQMMTGLNIPNLIMRDTNSGLGSSGSSERQVEMYHHFITGIYQRVTQDFLSSVVAQLIQYNFDPRVVREAYDYGDLPQLPIRWSETKVLVDAIAMLTDKGYISATDEADNNHVRDLLSFPRGKGVKKKGLAARDMDAAPKTSTPKVSTKSLKKVIKDPLTAGKVTVVRKKA